MTPSLVPSNTHRRFLVPNMVEFTRLYRFLSKYAIIECVTFFRMTKKADPSGWTLQVQNLRNKRSVSQTFES